MKAEIISIRDEGKKHRVIFQLQNDVGEIVSGPTMEDRPADEDHRAWVEAIAEVMSAESVPEEKVDELVALVFDGAEKEVASRFRIPEEKVSELREWLLANEVEAKQ